MIRQAVTGMALAALLLGGVSARAEDATVAAREAVATFVEAAASGDQVELDAVLAPEFQILRADGAGYDRTEYQPSERPVIDTSSQWHQKNLVATAADGLMVARYVLVIDETLDGRTLSRRAPPARRRLARIESWRRSAGSPGADHESTLPVAGPLLTNP